jgi:TfoX/Sxy family transcriptional regulator of competence genes
MAWRPSPPELIRRFDAAIPAGVERRKMFGYSAAFLGGRLFAGLHQESVVLRLGPADRAELLAVPGAERFEPMPGRAMGDFVVLAPSLAADDRALALWIERARAHAATLPPKAEKKKAPRKRRTRTS